MRYVVIKHTNNGETDHVEVVCVAATKSIAYKQILMTAEEYYEAYKVLEDSQYYKRFTDQFNEKLIEIELHEAPLIDW